MTAPRTLAMADALRGPADAVRACFAALRRDAAIPGDCRARHRQLVLRRMHTLAWTVATLVLAWIPIDLLWLGPAAARATLPLRLGIALSLAAWSRMTGRMPLSLAVAGFVGLQAIGLGALQWLVDLGHPAALQVGYGLFPFLLAAELALLALPWPRTLFAGLAPGVVLVLALLAQPPALGVAWSDGWLFVLILLLATWTGDAQRRLLVELLDARHDATHDVLTGLANRRSAEERLEAWRADATRHHEPLSVLLLDLDHFKRINDRHGHAAGDLVLQAVGKVLRDELRGGDLGARFGGEEFLVVLPHCAGDEAFETAERIRTRIAAMRVPVDHRALRITVSVGVAGLRTEESVASLLVRADAALYAAKARGRDRCVAAPARPRDGLTLHRESEPAAALPPVPEVH